MNKCIGSCFLVLLSLHNLCATEKQKKSKAKESLIGQTLTPTTALFPRHVYEKDKKGEEVEQKTTARTLLVFLDDNEFRSRQWGAITSDTALALFQKACPILVSGNLLHSIFIINFIDSRHPKKSVFELVVQQFNPEEWIIKAPLSAKEWGYPLYLLVPKKYIKERAKQGQLDLDKILGLQLSKMETIDESKEEWAQRFSSPDSDEAVSSDMAFDELINSRKNNLFVPASKYKADGKNVLPQWNIYIAGHGIKEKIAGLPLPSFARLLNFLNTRIITKIFIYASCYATGINQKQVYDEVSKNVGSTYSFPIVAWGTAEAVLEARVATAPSALLTGISYKEFTKLAELSEPVEYSRLLRTLISELDLFFQKKMSLKDIMIGPLLSSFSLIRFPHRSSFLPLIPMLDITQLMADARGKDRPLNMRNFIQKNIDSQLAIPSSELSKDRAFIVMLSAQYVPFDVIITRYRGLSEKNPFFIISTLSGETYATAMHVFDQRVIFDSSFDDFLFMLYNIKYREGKIFYIRSLILKDKAEYSDVIIHILPAKSVNKIVMRAFYTSARDGKKYSEFFLKKPTEITEDYLEDYADSLESIRDGYYTRNKKLEAQRKAIAKLPKKTK